MIPQTETTAVPSPLPCPTCLKKALRRLTVRIPRNATVYPDDFPEQMSTITVTGTFSIYEEGEYKYMTLKDAYMEV